MKVADLSLKPPQPAKMVFAEWKVPTIKTSPNEPGTQTVGFWVGLGGYSTGQLLQAGTAATVTGNSVSYWAWTEWVPAGYNTDSLAIQAGDTVSVLVCAPETDHGYVSMMNQRTNVAISIGVTDQGGTTHLRWIDGRVDRRGHRHPEMPDFGSVTFVHSIERGHAGRCHQSGARVYRKHGRERQDPGNGESPRAAE